MRGWIFCLLLASSCASPAYRDFYSHLTPYQGECFHETECFVILAVEARHLDYTDFTSFLKTLCKHPSDGSKNSDVGHAWIYLKKGNFVLEGGHSAETGVIQPRYMEGVCLLAEKGDANPARYLWAEQKDGYFEKGDGYHRATYAAKVDLTKEQFEQICTLVETYPFEHYAVTGQSCATFVAEVALIAGLRLDIWQAITLPPVVRCGGEVLPLWSDPCFAEILVASPDLLEKSLMQAVASGQAEAAKKWLLRHRSEAFVPRCRRTFNDLILLPRRTLRAINFFL